MVVARDNDAYGNAQKTVQVKKPVMLLATLPRVLGPQEEFVLPVNVFAMNKSIKNVKLKIEVNEFFELIDRGEAFAKGDVLEIELQISQKFDETVNTFITKSYQVNKIVRHLSRNEQQKINFNPE